ncbi:hypothetical protein [Nostoc sp. CHAB 5715]|uniref:hypothetical protein n=1 Tax=Nostoc sp. CHAB 5715 TaxID=2780400 RepID=UPI001E4D8023|nr:hypothetical protein [Nostoc sp. CHAB 5715]MCC5622566.1 hypothetical protein [Nostoc sp. CHAB 5715]
MALLLLVVISFINNIDIYYHGPNRVKSNPPQNIPHLNETTKVVGRDDILKTLPEDYGEPLPNNFLYILIIYLFILLVISIGSLISSYYLFSSNAWKREYGEQGWIIELARSLFLLTGTAALIGVSFSKEACEVLGWIRTSGVNKTLVFLVRFTLIFSFVTVCVIVTRHHFYTGPNHLKNNLSNFSIKLDPKREFLIPYLCYLPYSISTLLLTGLPVFTIGIYAAIKDLITLRIYRKNFSKTLISLEKSKELYINNEKTCQEIENQFNSFAVHFIDKIGRYTSLVLGSGFTTAFEYWFGQYTLSDAARTWTAFGYFLLFSIFALICVGFFFYESAFSESYQILDNIRCSNREDFENKFNIIKLLERILRRYLFLCIGLIMLTATIIHMLFISSGNSLTKPN